ncbi:hypothetical protein [Sinosporangium album]|nr:hypothetical protein [Sinosporangium album]
MCGWMGGVAFAHLTMGGNDIAQGRFLNEDLFFMTARSHLPPPRPPMVSGLGEARQSRIDPSILQDETGTWVAQLAVPQAQHSWSDDRAFLVDVGTGSRASAKPSPDGGWVAYQSGPVRLWDAVEDVILTWQEAGRPHQSEFGLTATPDEQWVWLGDPSGPRWYLPA